MRALISVYGYANPKFPPKRIVLCLMAFWLLARTPAESQQMAFGAVWKFQLTEHFDHVTAFSVSSKQEFQFLLWSQGKRIIALGRIDHETRSLSLQKKVLPIAPHSLLAVDINGDAVRDLILSDATEPVISMVTNIRPDSLHASSVVSLSSTVTDIYAVDISNDGMTDILAFSKDAPGMIPILGSKTGRFRVRETMIPDVPVGNVTETHLNDDGLIDLIVNDWVRSELHFLYGVGRGRFLDQTVLPVSGEVQRLTATVSRTGVVDLVLLTRQPDQVQIWEEDGFGDFRLLSSCDLPTAASSSALRDVNDDGWSDIVLADDRSLLSVVFNTKEETLDDILELAAGHRPADMTPLGRTSGLEHILVLDGKAPELRLFHDAREEVRLVDSLQFAVGFGPTAVWVGDMNLDGHSDVVVANRKGKSLNFFQGRRPSMLGATGVRLQMEPSYLGFHSASDSVVTFFLSYPSERSISFLSYDEKNQSHSEAVIPDVGILEPLAPGLSREPLIEYYCFSAPGESETPSLSFFQQLKGSKFIERSFRLTIPDTLMGAGVADVNEDRIMDVAYVYQNASTKRYDLVLMYGDSSGEFTKRAFSAELDDSVISKSYMYFADFNNDALLDMLLCFPKTARTLRLSLGTGDGIHTAPEKLDIDIRIADRAQLQIVDVDGDGVLDIAANDRGKKELGFLRGNGDGTFEPWLPLMGSSGISHFGVADFNGDSIPDIVVTMQEEGVVRFYDGKKLRSR